jgi:hypothetical protein
MVKVVYADPAPKSVRNAKAAGLGEKRVRGEGGSLIRLRTLDAGSATLSEDITEAFARNVAKARRENKKLLGVADIAPAKR